MKRMKLVWWIIYSYNVIKEATWKFGRNSIIIRNVNKDSEDYKNALYKYSLYDKVYRKYTFSAFFEDGNDLYFPSSITVNELKKIFTKEEIQVNYGITAKAKSLQYQMIHAPRDDLQKKAIEFLMKMKRDPETH
jgi:hypothetical protein